MHCRYYVTYVLAGPCVSKGLRVSRVLRVRYVLLLL